MTSDAHKPRLPSEDVIITLAGVAPSCEVLGDKPARVVCVDSPKRPKPN